MTDEAMSPLRRRMGGRASLGLSASGCATTHHLLVNRSGFFDGTCCCCWIGCSWTGRYFDSTAAQESQPAASILPRVLARGPRLSRPRVWLLLTRQPPPRDSTVRPSV